MILRRQQLFTEQTLTSILPLFSSHRPQGNRLNVARLWLIVLVANLAGTAALAPATAWRPAFHRKRPCGVPADRQRDARTVLGRHPRPGDLRRIPDRNDGVAVARRGSSRLWIVVILAYFVGLGGLAHVIAGSAESLYVVFKGEAPLGAYLWGFLVPSLLGNSIGGVALVASLAHGQHAPER